MILAFFPCTRFECQITLYFKGESTGQKNWSDEKKLEHSMKLHDELHELYMLLSKLCVIALRKKLRLIIENPVTQPHYLTSYWCLKPSLVDKDRSMNGDYFKKPTQYFFLNCSPENKLLDEPMEIQLERRTINNCGGGKERKVERSMISPVYARRFIKTYIL